MKSLYYFLYVYTLLLHTQNTLDQHRLFENPETNNSSNPNKNSDLF